MSIARTWGTHSEERALAYASDRYVDAPFDALYRGVTVDAPAATVFRWLCQLRAAPYSYDWLDNLGRRSPRTLTPGLDALEVGQRFMRIFELVEFEPGRHVTLRLRDRGLASRLFGSVAVTYLVIGDVAGPTRLLAKLCVRYPRAPLGWVMRMLLPPGDLVMMRRQLLNLKCLAERPARESAA